MRYHFQRNLLRLTAVWTVFAAFGLSSAYSAEDLWIISTRCVAWDGCEPAPSDAPLDYWRLDDHCQWAAADAAAFRASDDPAVATTFVIPGNRTDTDKAVDLGWGVYQQLKACAAGRSLRVVIWLWPADRIRGGNRQDVRVKADRCDVECFLLARTLDRMNPAVRVNLVGHSFGARIAMDALELLAGGSINCQALGTVPIFAGTIAQRWSTKMGLSPSTHPQQDHSPRAPCRAMLVAAAMDSDWLLPGHRDGQALSQVDHLLVTVNPADFVLRLYPLMYHAHGPTAVGSTGPCLAEAAKVELLDACCSVGRRHDWDDYFCDPDLRSALVRYAFFDQPAAAPTVAHP